MTILNKTSQKPYFFKIFGCFFICVFLFDYESAIYRIQILGVFYIW